MGIKLDINSLKLMTLFENATGARVKDYFELDGLRYFIVLEGEMGKAIGRNGMNIRKLEGILNAKVKIAEYNQDMLEFIKNLLYPLRLHSAEEKDDVKDGKNIRTVYLEALDVKTRGLIIGRNANALRNLEKAVQRYFKLDEIKVS